jgi:predicted SAM-dependent methyltransferase
MTMALRALETPKRTKPLKLDLGSGQNPREGFAGVDLLPGPKVQYVVDLWQFPWPFEDGSVGEVNLSHVVEHIPHYRPDWGETDGWFMFWNEVHRITRKGALIHVVHPYVKSDRAFWDPTHTRYIHEMTWYYLDPTWMKANGLDHYPVTADFEVLVISGAGLADDLVNRNIEHQNYARAHYWNAIPDLVVELKRR